MTAPEPVSIMGSERGDFRPGAGRCRTRSAWKNRGRKKFIRAAFGGRPPSFADREFWQYAGGAVPVYSAGTVRWRRFTLAIGNAIGRFYRRS